jgi:membrane fusion protein, copper/silver efflux system
MRRKITYTVIVFALLVLAFLTGSRLFPKGSKTERTNSPIPVLKTPEKSSPGSETKSGTDDGSLPPGTVSLSPEKQQLSGIKVADVKKAPWTGTLRVLGKVAPDEIRIYRINAATDGWVKKILPVTTGSLVKKDELLASFYAPEFFSAMKAFLYGLRSFDRFQKSGTETKEQLETTDANVDNYRNGLRNLGMTDHQLDEITRTRKGGDQVEIRAPEAGFILIRNITLGERFQRGTELYRIADLSKVWIVVDTFETEASNFKPGMPVKVFAPNLNKSFPARVSRVPPRFEPSSRTLQIRLEANNPGLVLRPDMFVDVEIGLAFPPAIYVPADAILDSGLRKTVFVDLGQGYFEPREVKTGRRSGNHIEITQGLSSGERIITSGTFLVDSESRMEQAATGMSGSLSKDPVSGMEVSMRGAEKTGRKSSYQGLTYYFASEENRTRFNQDPGRYVKKHSEEPPGGGLPPTPNSSKR